MSNQKKKTKSKMIIVGILVFHQIANYNIGKKNKKTSGLLKF